MHFVDDDLLMTIKEFELGDINAKDADVYLYLREESKVRHPNELIDYLYLNVGIDPGATSGSKRLLSLMKSLRSAKSQLGLQESAKKADDIILPLDVQKEILLSKLPPQFRKQFSFIRKFPQNPR